MNAVVRTTMIMMIFSAISTVAAVSIMAAVTQVPEPGGLWSGPMQGQTPETLSGAEVINVDGLEALMARKLLLLDVGSADRRPEVLPEGWLWLPVHRSIPGAVWMPGAGDAPIDPTLE